MVAEASEAGLANVRYLENTKCHPVMIKMTPCVSPLVDVDRLLLISLVDTFVDFHLVSLLCAAAAQTPAQSAASGPCHEPVSRVTNIVTLLSQCHTHRSTLRSGSRGWRAR